MQNSFMGGRIVSSCVMSFLVLSVALTSVVVNAGPPASKPDAAKAAATQAPKPPTEIDRSRAFLTLAQIEPKIEEPKTPSDLVPLPDRAAEPISASRKLIAEQRYTEAALELERALRYAPSHPEIHAHLAMLHWQAGNLERAKKSAALTVDGNPQSVVGHYILGRCLAAGGDRPGAMRELRTATLCAEFGTDPEVTALVHFHLAEMLSAEGYLSAAIEQYEAFGRVSAKSTPSPKGELASLMATRRGSMEQSKADMLEKLGRYEDAAIVLRPIVEKAAGDVALQVRYANLLLLANRPDQAGAALAGLDTDDEKVLDLLADIRRKAGQPGLIIEDLRAKAKAHPDSANIANRLAKALLDSDRAEEAHTVLTDFLARQPDNAAIRQTQLDLLVRTKRWNEALRLSAAKLKADPSSEREVESILVALRASPDTVDDIIASAPAAQQDQFLLYLIGRTAVDAQRVDDAERILRQSLAIDPKFIPARSALGELLVRKCDLEGARQVAARTDSDAAEDARLEYVLGLIYDRLDDPDRAELHYRAATQIDRADVRSMYALANVYLRANKGLQAQRQLRALLDLRQTHEPARELLAMALLAEGKVEGWRQEYLHIEKTSQSITTKARARILLDESLRKNPEERRRILLEAIEAGGADAPAMAALAETYEDTEPEKAREFYAKAVALDPDDEESMLGVLRADQHQLRFEKVAEGLEELLRCRPNRHVWRRMLVGMYTLLEQFDKAINLAAQQEARADLDPARRTEYRETLIEALREAGRRDEAIARLQGWANDDAKGGEWTQRLALEYVRQRKYEDAARTYQSLYELAPENKAVRDRLLDTLTQVGRHTRAEQYLVQWFAEEPQNDRLVLALAQVISRAGRVDEAMDLINTWLLKTPRRELFQNMQVSILAAAGRSDECAQLLEELADEVMAIVRVGGDPSRLPPPDQLADERRVRLPNEPYSPDKLHDRVEQLRMARISALGSAKRFREAQALIDELTQANAGSGPVVELLARQANLYRLQGREDEAIAVLQSALPLRASTESLSNDISYSWIDRGIKLHDAEKLITHALGRIPRQAAYLDTYGWLLYKKGDFENARLWLTRANRVRGGDDPVIYDHLGDTHWRLGQREEAIAQWKTAVELVKDKTEHELTNDDERRVKRTTSQKIADAATSEGPKIAPLADEPPLAIEDEPK